MHLTPVPAVLDRVSIVGCDVSAYKLNLFCLDLSEPGAVAEWEIDNATAAITVTLHAIRELAAARGISQLRVVVEPTGIYHQLILRIARSLGLLTGLVDPDTSRRCARSCSAMTARPTGGTPAPSKRSWPRDG